MVDDSIPSPWDPDALAAEVQPIISYWNRLTGAQQQAHSLLTVVPKRLWVSRADLPSFSIPGTCRALGRQFDKPGLEHIRLIAILDVISSPPFRDPTGDIGWQFHFHILAGVGARDKAMKALVRKRLRRWAPGPRALKFQAVDDHRGGIQGWANYALKDWRHPQKRTPVGKQECRDRRTGELRDFLARSQLRPADLIVLKNLKRVHGKIVPIRGDGDSDAP